MPEMMKRFRDWTSTLREDVETLKAVVDAKDAPVEGRRFAAAALNYLLTRMDLVPDWEESIGILDDVLVLRALADLAMQKGVDAHLSSDTQVALARLVAEVEHGRTWLGNDLWTRFAKHCESLVDTSVRGRSPGVIVQDADARKAVYGELEDHIKTLPPHAFSDADDVAVRFKAYIQHKLK